MHSDPNDPPQPISADEVQRLHDELAPALTAYLKMLLGSDADAADCLQNCFAMLVQRGGHCAPAARRAWLYQVARNQAALVRRRAAARQRVLRQAVQQRGAAQTPSEQDDASTWLLAQERREQVQRALASLPDTQRRVVELRIRESLTFQQIASQLDIPLGTALGRMRDALKRLAALLNDEP